MATPTPTPCTPAPGLRADWLNAWLAAIGITVLVPEVRLSWTTDPRPYAVLHHPRAGSPSLPRLIAEQMPTTEHLATLVIARFHDAHPGAELPRIVPDEVFKARAVLARASGDPTLAASLTDLGEKDEEAEHSPLDPPAPKGTTLWDRAAACLSRMQDDCLSASLAASLSGTARRVQANGLGFDATRLLTPTDPNGQTWVDPCVEILAFTGMTVLPVRGDGHRARARGWTGPASRAGAFTWPVWSQPLSAPGIDAVLDLFWSAHAGSAVTRYGVTGAFQSVPYRPRGSADTTRAYASRRLPWTR